MLVKAVYLVAADGGGCRLAVVRPRVGRVWSVKGTAMFDRNKPIGSLLPPGSFRSWVRNRAGNRLGLSVSLGLRGIGLLRR